MTLSVTPAGRIGRREGARTVRVKLVESSAYRCAERVSRELGWVSRVVYETEAAVAAAKEMEGMPSLVASAAAPLLEWYT